MRLTKPFPFYKQHDAMDCGPTCLRMIAKHYGRNHSLQTLRERSQISREGVSLLGISEAAETLGFRTLGVRIGFDQLISEAVLPCVVHWQQNHFVVVYRVRKPKSWLSFQKEVTIDVADPGKGLIRYAETEFLAGWLSTQNNGQSEGIVLLLEPTPALYDQEDQPSGELGFGRLFGYLFAYKKLVVQLGLSLLVGSGLQLIFPFLAQSIVDVGIHTKNLHFVYLVLAAQLMLLAGRLSVDFIRSWILLHISARINLSILSDFLSKLMRLPLSFFDTKLLSGTSAQTPTDRFFEAFFFSAQTYTTVGYGRINPTGLPANFVVVFELLLGLLSLALATGLFYARSARPVGKIMFSQKMLVAPYRGQSALMFRIANAQDNQLIEIEVQIVLSIIEEEEPGKNVRKYYQLPLERDKINFLSLSWTIVHPLNENSPLYGNTEADLEKADAEFMVLIKGFDDTYFQSVYVRSSYKYDEMMWGARFKNTYDRSASGKTVLDLSALGACERAELPGSNQ